MKSRKGTPTGILPVAYCNECEHGDDFGVYDIVVDCRIDPYRRDIYSEYNGKLLKTIFGKGLKKNDHGNCKFYKARKSKWWEFWRRRNEKTN